jgi:hypothetical protein
MAFVVEDGTGVANANAYCTVAFATGYFRDRGINAWLDIDDNLTYQQAIIRATDYIELRFADRFIGERKADDQSLSWPRISGAPIMVPVMPYAGMTYGVGYAAYSPEQMSFPADVVPLTLQKACAEYALRALTTTLASDPTMDPTGMTIKSTSEKLGPIEEKIEYVGQTTPALFKPYPAADGLLKPLLTAGGNRIIRA